MRRFAYDTTMMLFGGSLTLMLSIDGFNWWWGLLAGISYIANIVIEFHDPKVQWG